MAELLRDEGVDGALAGAARYRTDGARSEALGALLVQLEERAEEAARVVRASPRLLTSDGDRASFLTHALRAVGLGTQAMRTAYFDAAGGLGSDGDWARVLVAALHDEGRRTDVVLGVIRSLGGRDRSDGDETRVLLAVPESMLGRSEVSRAYLSALRTVHSDGDKARALSRSALLQ